MDMQSQVRAALKEKNPALFQQLTKAGILTAFVQDQAEEINDQIVTLMMQMASKQGCFKPPFMDPLKRVGIMNSADKMAREIVLAEMLNFPTDES
jgi:hypothetical protein